MGLSSSPLASDTRGLSQPAESEVLASEAADSDLEIQNIHAGPDGSCEEKSPRLGYSSLCPPQL